MSGQLAYFLLFFIGCGVVVLGLGAVFACILGGLTDRRTIDAADALQAECEELEDQLFFDNLEREMRRSQRGGA